MSTKKKVVRIVDPNEVSGPAMDESDYWMSCRKPTVITLNIILIVSRLGYLQQCDQMAKLYFQICLFTAIKIDQWQ